MLECIKNGVLPIEDDDMDAVAGGMTKKKKEEVKALAAADGRNYRLPVLNLLCMCNNDYKWARTKYKSTAVGYEDSDVYRDIKCYNCGKTWDAHSQGGGHPFDFSSPGYSLPDW